MRKFYAAMPDRCFHEIKVEDIACERTGKGFHKNIEIRIKGFLKYAKSVILLENTGGIENE